MKIYRLLTGPDDAKFCERVSNALNEGWKLHGSPAVTFNGKNVVAAQAIVQESKGKYPADVKKFFAKK